MQLRVVVSNVSSIVRFDVRFALLRDAPCVVMNDRGFDGGAITLGGATMSSCAAVGTSLGKRRESSVDATETTDGDRGGNMAGVSKALLLLPETTPRPASGVKKYGSTISAVAIVMCCRLRFAATYLCWSHACRRSSSLSLCWIWHSK